MTLSSLSDSILAMTAGTGGLGGNTNFLVEVPVDKQFSWSPWTKLEGMWMAAVHSDKKKVVVLSQRCPLSEAGGEEEVFQEDLF